MIAAALQLFNIWPDGLRLAIPLLGVLQILQAVLLWNKKRDQAASFLFVGFFIGIVCIIVFGV